eukprot:403362868
MLIIHILPTFFFLVMQIRGNTDCFSSSMKLVGCGLERSNCLGNSMTEMGIVYPLTLSYGYIGVGATESPGVIDATGITPRYCGLIIIKYDDYMNIEYGRQIKNAEVSQISNMLQGNYITLGNTQKLLAIISEYNVDFIVFDVQSGQIQSQWQ